MVLGGLARRFGDVTRRRWRAPQDPDPSAIEAVKLLIRFVLEIDGGERPSSD